MLCVCWVKVSFHWLLAERHEHHQPARVAEESSLSSTRIEHISLISANRMVTMLVVVLADENVGTLLGVDRSAIVIIVTCHRNFNRRNK